MGEVGEEREEREVSTYFIYMLFMQAPLHRCRISKQIKYYKKLESILRIRGNEIRDLELFMAIRKKRESVFLTF